MLEFRKPISAVAVFTLLFFNACYLVDLTPPTSTTSLAEMQNGYGAGVAINTGINSELLFYQSTYTNQPPNGGGSVSADVTNNPYSFGFFIDPNDGEKLKWILGDRGNNRILIYNHVPSDPSVLPDVVVGQNDFSSNGANAGQSSVNAFGFNSLTHVSVSPTGQMFVSDRSNNRVMVYNKIPQQSGVAADYVIGQTDFTSSASGSTGSTLNLPYAVYVIKNTLYVADKLNNRILGFSPVPTASGASASFVIGQPDLNTVASSCAANGLSQPFDMAFHDGIFYVADGNNHRVLAYPALPTQTGAVAAQVVGQTSMTSCGINQGAGASTPSSSSFYFPESLAFKDGYLVVDDSFNSRLLAFTLPVTTNQVASAVIGQTDFVSKGANTTYHGLSYPRTLVFDGNFVWIGDVSNSRVVRYGVSF